jgi:hypothetical protein
MTEGNKGKLLLQPGIDNQHDPEDQAYEHFFAENRSSGSFSLSLSSFDRC